MQASLGERCHTTSTRGTQTRTQTPSGGPARDKSAHSGNGHQSWLAATDQSADNQKLKRLTREVFRELRLDECLKGEATEFGLLTLGGLKV